MYFDKLAGIAERHLPDIFNVIKQSHLFKFPGRAQEVLPKRFSNEEIAFLDENFFLPFQHIAIEDNVSCIILYDDQPDVKGANRKRGFIECQPLIPKANERADYNSDEDYKSTQEALAEFIKFNGGLPYNSEDIVIVSVGIIQEFRIEHKPFIDGSLKYSVVLNKKEIISTNFATEMIEAALGNVLTAYQEIMFFNNPSRFVVEKTSIKPKRDVPKRIRRSHERPTYTLLTPTEIATNLDLIHPDEKSKRNIERQKSKTKVN